MALFGFGKKKDEEKNIPACACQSDCVRLLKRQKRTQTR